MKARMLKLQMKTMLITYYDSSNIVHFEFPPLGQTVKLFLAQKSITRME
jgi:hypothetical protein